ncbi:DHHC palmitoyltransferase-domain-containing protein [Multifurca ochricompacta]|uniref:Palmitoyltransferase n=1 Tax=Multifurca ochricompacta TaxID=376703 RepID=A0AAD4M689_9AGAM|nr:DHHC palmitoyltransferase-domain-containing protein [Multifurca ochricompacta]
MAENSLPLLSFELGTLPPTPKPTDDDSDDGHPGNPRRWYHYVPLFAVLSLLAPHPSILHVLLNYHYLTLRMPQYFVIHLLVIYTLSFLAFSSLIVCVARDPGPVPDAQSEAQTNDAGGEISLEVALLSTPPEDYTQPGKWCRICWKPKPERTHHCSQCGRCVLKMDHHCPWLGAKCIGFRTYTSFLHFLASITLLAAYVAVVCIRGLVFAFSHPLAINEMTPVHMLILSFAGCAFAIIIGSFLGYHVYLHKSNDTEHISPFVLLRHLPPLPPCRLSSPPLEYQLTFAQRRAVRAAHARMSLYDVGWRRNAGQVLGIGTKHRWQAWAARLLWGGSCYGTGTQFPRNPRADDVLTELAVELVRLENSAN